MATRLLTIFVFILAIFSAVVTTLMLTKNSDAPAATVDAAQLEKAINDFIENKPEAIVQAFMKAQAKQAELEEQKAGEKISEKKEELENDKTSPFSGNENGDVKIVMFFDFNCGYCHKIAPDIEKLVQEDKNIKLIMKDFPILGDMSHEMGKASVAVFNIAPDKWYNFYMAMVEKTPRSPEQITALVESVGVNKDQFKAEVAKSEVENKIQANLALGQTIGVRGTPALVVNGEFIKGAVGLDALKETVKVAREKAAK